MKELISVSKRKDPFHEEIQSYALVRSVSGEHAISSSKLRKIASELMIAISKACFASGAAEIGHIKAHLEYEKGFLRVDTLGSPDDVMVEGKDGGDIRHFSIVINSVVFGLPQEAIRSATEEALVSVYSRFGLRETGNQTNQKRK